MCSTSRRLCEDFTLLIDQCKIRSWASQEPAVKNSDIRWLCLSFLSFSIYFFSTDCRVGLAQRSSCQQNVQELRPVLGRNQCILWPLCKRGEMEGWLLVNGTNPLQYHVCIRESDRCILRFSALQMHVTKLEGNSYAAAQTHLWHSLTMEGVPTRLGS